MTHYSESYTTRSAFWIGMTVASIALLAVCILWVLHTQFQKGTPMIAAGFWLLSAGACGWTVLFPKQYSLRIDSESVVFTEPGARGIVPVAELKRVEVLVGGVMVLHLPAQRLTCSTVALRSPQKFIASLRALAPGLEIEYLGKRVLFEAGETHPT